MRLDEAIAIYHQGSEIQKIYCQNEVVYDASRVIGLATLDGNKYRALRDKYLSKLARQTGLIDNGIRFLSQGTYVLPKDDCVYDYYTDIISTADSTCPIYGYTYTYKHKQYFDICCLKIVSLPIYVGDLFKNCKVYFNHNVDTHLVENFDECFTNATIYNIDFDFTNVQSLNYTFQNTAFDTFHLSNKFISHTNEDISLYSAFADSNITSTDLNKLFNKQFFVKDIRNLDYTFSNCSNLTTINLSYLDMNSFISFYGTFLNCSNLTSLVLPNDIPEQKTPINLYETFNQATHLNKESIYQFLNFYDLSTSYFVRCFHDTLIEEIDLTDENGEFHGTLDYPFENSHLTNLKIGKVDMEGHELLQGACANCTYLTVLNFTPYYSTWSGVINSTTAHIAPKSRRRIDGFFKNTNFEYYDYFNNIIFDKRMPMNVFLNCTNLISGQLNIYNVTDFDMSFKNETIMNWNLYSYYSIEPEELLTTSFSFARSFEGSNIQVLNKVKNALAIPSNNWNDYLNEVSMYSCFEGFVGNIDLSGENLFNKIKEVTGNNIFKDSTSQYIKFNFILSNEKSTFENCTNLISINNNDLIYFKEQGNYEFISTFENCTSLKELNLNIPRMNKSHGIKILVENTFNDCINLERIYINTDDYTCTRDEMNICDSSGNPIDDSTYSEYNIDVKKIVFNQCVKLEGESGTNYDSEGAGHAAWIPTRTYYFGYDERQGSKVRKGYFSNYKNKI